MHRLYLASVAITMAADMNSYARLVHACKFYTLFHLGLGYFPELNAGQCLTPLPSPGVLLSIGEVLLTAILTLRDDRLPDEEELRQNL
jgi:hypothetical protein